MSVLDQLSEDRGDENPNNGGVSVAGSSAAASIVASVGQAYTQAARDALQSQGIELIDTRLAPVPVGSRGTIDLTKAFEINSNYRRLIVQDQLKDLRFNPTVEDVLDGGIKNGSKVVVEIVNESSGIGSKSYSDVVRNSVGTSRSGIPRSLVFDKFSVLNITEPDEARYQIHETFGAEFIQSFGRRPRILIFSGNVLNGKLDVQIGSATRSMDWKNAFQRYYDDFFSLDACVKRNNKARIYAQDTIYDGYALNLVANTTAMDQGISQVTISFILKEKRYARERDDLIPGFVTDTGFRISGGLTPDQFMPESRIEFFFRENPDFIILEKYKQIVEDQTEILRKIAILDGPDTSQSDVLNAFLIRRNETKRIANLANGISAHVTLFGIAIGSQLQLLSSQEAALEAQKANFIANNFNFPEGEVNELLDSMSDADPITYNELKKSESTLRLTRVGLIERLLEINALCLDYDDLEKDRLEAASAIKDILDAQVADEYQEVFDNASKDIEQKEQYYEEIPGISSIA